jgi:hypothetical protein
MLRARSDARAIGDDALEEVLDDAIRVVVMMRRPVLSQEHLLGAFWTTARLLLRQHREGRHSIRVGSRTRRDWEKVAPSLVARDPDIEDVLLLRDRAARAADYLAQLSELEQRVVVTMAVDGLGIKAAAKALGETIAAVKAAQHSARIKLDRIAAISAAGRMCGYRGPTIAEYMRGSADPQQERLARAHLLACAACRAEHAKLLREMRGRRFQHDAAVILLPSSLLHADHPLRVVARTLSRFVPLPRFGAERAAEALGGASAVKLAAAGGAVLLATATLAGVRPPVLPAPTRHHRQSATPQRSLAARAGLGPAKLPAPGVPTPSGSGRSRRARLTPQQRAEIEFTVPSAGQPTMRGEDNATTAAVAPSTANAVAGQPRPAPRILHHADTGSMHAAREFGQP